MQSEQPSNGHLGTSWEIAIVVIFVVLVIVIVAATVFQIRRRRKQKRQRELENDTESAKTPQRKTRAQEKRRRTDSVHTVDEMIEKNNSVGVRDERSIDEEVQKPSPSFQSKRASANSSYSEYLTKKPPNYYWEQRLH